MTFFITIGIIILIFFYNIIKKKLLGSTLYKCRVSDCDYMKKIDENYYTIGLIIGYVFVLISMAIMISGNDFYGVYSSMFLTGGFGFIYKCKKMKSILSIKDNGISYLFTHIKWEHITGFDINDEKLYLKTHNNGLLYRYMIQIKDKENLQTFINKKLNK